MLDVSSVQFSLATEHTVPLLVQLIRVFTGTIGSLDGPSSYPTELQSPTSQACQQTILYCNHCQSHWGCRFGAYLLASPSRCVLPTRCIPDLALVDDLGLQLLRSESQVTLLLSTLPPLPNGHHLPLPTDVAWVLSIAMQLEAMVPIGYRFWKSIQWIFKASEHRVSAHSRSS
ncbi:hypothetical protein EDB83DRAFT_2369143 [Lactarius deliciosus]|nr:hypothetical protein EDB83DRAFT_2369143 [Lactarius deliciosus]